MAESASNYVFDRLHTEASALIAATGLAAADSITLSEPKANVSADLAFPVFAAAKAASINPNEFAKQLANTITPSSDSLIDHVVAVGGFLNLSMSPEKFASAVLANIAERGDAYGKDYGVGAGKTVAVQFPSPDISAKPRTDNLRSMVIANSICSILTALGYHVIREIRLGDWGVPFGTILAALDLSKREPWSDSNPAQALEEIRAAFNVAVYGDPTLDDLRNTWFKKLQEGDPWARDTWQRIVAVYHGQFDRFCARLGIAFDTKQSDSEFESAIDRIVQETLEKSVAQLGEGTAVAVTFGEENDSLPSCILRKTDGGSLYLTRTLAAILYRGRTDASVPTIYVALSEQKLFFEQLFEIIRRMGYGEIADNSYYIPVGGIRCFRHVVNEDGTKHRLLCRPHDTPSLDTVLDNSTESVGIGHVIYANLCKGLERDIALEWKEQWLFEDTTYLYVQGAYARCKRLLSGGEAHLISNNSELLIAQEEQAVIKQLARFPQAVRDAGEKFLPATIADWTYNLAREFSRFYDKCPVLTAETAELKSARLQLVSAAALGLKNGLALLGIGAPERM